MTGKTRLKPVLLLLLVFLLAPAWTWAQDCNISLEFYESSILEYNATSGWLRVNVTNPKGCSYAVSTTADWIDSESCHS